MIKKLSAFVFKDIGWKILALLSAVLLYLIIIYVDNPYQKRSFSRPIIYINENVLTERGFIILNRDKRPLSVQVSIWAKLQDLENLLGVPTFTAVVDLSAIDESYNNWLREPISLPININLPPEYTKMGSTPEKVTIYIDKVISEPRPVELNITGTVKDGYENMAALYLDTVTVTAPESVIRTISRIGADIDIEGADKDVVVNEAELHVYDADNKDITPAVTLSMEKIRVEIPVYPIKTVPVIARIAGNPAPGYWVSEEIPSPKTVDLVGPADALAEINEIKLEPIPLNGVTSDISQDFNIWEYLKGTRLSIRSNGVFNVNVTVKIDKEARKHLDVLPANINFIRENTSLLTQLPAAPISVVIQGPENAIGGITSDNLHGELDLTGLSPGIYDVVLHLDLPANVTVFNAPVKLRVVISEEPITATVMPGNSQDANTDVPDAGLSAEPDVPDAGLTAGPDAQAMESEPPDNIAPSGAPETEGAVSAQPNG